MRLALLAALCLTACADAPRRPVGEGTSICLANPVTCERYRVRPWDAEVWTGNLQP